MNSEIPDRARSLQRGVRRSASVSVPRIKQRPAGEQIGGTSQSSKTRCDKNSMTVTENSSQVAAGGNNTPSDSKNSEMGQNDSSGNQNTSNC